MRKVAKVVPICKSETRLLCNNYKPICLLSNIGKIIEKLIQLRRLSLFLETRNCYYPFKFGFRINVSTNNALMSIVENIQTQLDDGKYSAGVFVDLKKAFDTVDHVSTQVIQTGVPQGFVLGPVLFLLYINVINKSIKNLQMIQISCVLINHLKY